MKRIIMFVLLFAALKVAGQTTGYLRFDTVKIMKQNGTCELYIINKTKDSLGLLTNVGGGLTQFKRARAINDSMLIIGLDTITIHGTGLNLQQVTDNGQKTTDTIVAGGLRTQNIIADTADQDDFEIDVFPDIQVMTSPLADSSIVGSMFNWVVANRNTENIKAVLQVGDLTNEALVESFERIDSNYDKFDAMPAPELNYLAVPGNHDYDAGNLSGSSRPLTKYNTYLGPSRFASKSFYVGNFQNSNANYAIKFDASGHKYLVIGLEMNPRDSALDWARNILDSLSDREAIIVTHAYITYWGEKSVDSSKYSSAWYGVTNDNDGQDLWDKFIKHYKQMIMVVNGHFIFKGNSVAEGLSNTNLSLPAVKRITQSGINGNTVYQMVVNYQTDSMGGNGYFMRLKFKPRTSKLDVSFYSPYLNRYDARFPSYSLDYPAIKVSGSASFGAGNTNIAGETRFDSAVYFTKLTKNRLAVFEINGQLDTLSNSDSAKILASYGYKNKAQFRLLTASDIPLDSTKNILNQNAYSQTANFRIKGTIGAANTTNGTVATSLALPLAFSFVHGSANYGLGIGRATTPSGGANFSLYQAGSDNATSPTAAVPVGASLGAINWHGTAGDLSYRRGMYIRGFVHTVGSNYLSSGFDFRTINSAGTDIQVMNIHPDGRSIIGPSLTGSTNPDRLFVDGTLRVGDTVKTPNIATKSDTTNFKPVVVDASGNHFKMNGWPLVAGSLTSINSQAGPAITFASGVATYVTNPSANTLAYNFDPTSSVISRTIDVQFTTASNTGTSETDLFTKTIAGGTLGTNGQTLNFEIDGEVNDNTATAQIKLYFGGNTTLNTGAINISTAATAWKITGMIVRTSPTTAHVTYELDALGLATPKFLGYSNLTSLDFTASNIFKVTAQAGGAGGGNGDITAHSWQILYKPN